MVNITFFNAAAWEEKYLKELIKSKAAFKKHTISFHSGKLNKKTASKAKNAEVVSVFVHGSLTNETLTQLPKLKLVATRSTGYDHVDLSYCKGRKIAVSNVPAYGENTVAEQTFALMLAMSRKIPKSVAKIKQGHFDRKGIRGFDLNGKTLGVVGTGRIGQHVIKIAHGFGMNIIAFDVFKHDELVKNYGIKYVSMPKLLKTSDIITFHVPLNPHTKHMINTTNVEQLKKGVHLVNTSRGPVIETAALIKGLKKKIIGGAALDVLEDESFIGNDKVLLDEAFITNRDIKVLLEEHILTEQDNVIITPHNAFNTQEALERILDTTIKNIEGYLKKRTPNRVA